MRHSPRFALKALLKFSLGALNQNIHTVLSSSSDNNRPITEICQKLGGAKNMFQKNWLFDIAKIRYHPTIILVDQLDKMGPGQISFTAVEEKHCYICNELRFVYM